MVKRGQETKGNIRRKRKCCPKKLIDDFTKLGSHGIQKTEYLL